MGHEHKQVAQPHKFSELLQVAQLAKTQYDGFQLVVEEIIIDQPLQGNNSQQ
jgi:hypothetical protein